MKSTDKKAKFNLFIKGKKTLRRNLYVKFRVDAFKHLSGIHCVTDIAC